MGARKTTNSRKTVRKNSRRTDHWKSLPRDSKGRWVKSRKRKRTQQKEPAPSKTAAKAPKNSQNTAKVSSKVEPIPYIPPNNLCPRCGGDMHAHRIRCGPNRLVSVEKCEICNFWLPIGEHQSQPKQEAYA